MLSKLLLLASRALTWVRDKYADDEETRLWEAHNAAERAYEERLSAEVAQWRDRLRKAGIRYDV